MSELKNKTIGGFQILQEIQAGSGSQGTVYKAVCVDTKDNLVPAGTVVALKVMAVQDEGRTQWKKLEKRTNELVRMSNENVVRYYGCFSESGLFNDVHVVVQEFLQGETLKERLTRYASGLDVDEALRIADAALSGFVYISTCGIIHRDIKPGNIFLCDDGAVKIIDFEIARQNGGTTTSSAGNIRGSFDYMAPDFINADFHGDMQSDVFSMGVVLHEMLTGKLPYKRLEGDNKQANFAFLSRWAHTLAGEDNPIHISSRINRLLAHAEDALTKSLAPQRNDRYGDFQAFQDGLKAIRFRNLRNGQNTYKMLQFVGKGGFGEVFKARFQQTGQLVAIKHLLSADYAERFYREAKIMRKLHDSCFVQFVDFFAMDVGNNREAFLVMAFLDGMPGSSLRDAIKNSTDQILPRRDVFKAFERYARGLQVLHAKEIYHRDIKPANLYYPPGRPESAAIMDLGIARDVSGTATHGIVPGTLEYMPPEVVLTDNRGDGGMDIYALGLCFYEALTAKTGYPRLPTGTAAYAALFERAKSKRKPVFDDPSVKEDPELLALLNEMTNPELSLRIRDAGILVARIRHLIKNRFPDVEDKDNGCSFEDERTTLSEFERDTGSETVALDEVTRATEAVGFGGADLQAIEREREHIQAKRRTRGSIIAASAVLSVCAASYFAWKPVKVHYAGTVLDEVIRAYQSGDDKYALQKELAWRVQWEPASRRWLKLDAGTYSNFVGKLDAAKGEIETAKVNKEKADRRNRARLEALARIKACRAANGKLDEEHFRKLDAWSVPESIKNDEEIDRSIASLNKCIAAAVLEKLSVEPLLTRANRINAAKEILNNSWTAKILSQTEREKLSKEVDSFSVWCVATVKNNCGSEIQLDGRIVAAGASVTAVYKDGHSENGVITRKGYKQIHLPAGLDGMTHEVRDESFEPNPLTVVFPRLEADVKCIFRGKEVRGGESVALLPGNYMCTYRRGNTYEPQIVEFSVRVNVQTFIPGPKEWIHTKEYIAKENARAEKEKERLEREKERREKEKARKERDRILRETPVTVEIPDFGAGVALTLDGRKQKPGAIKLKPGKYDFHYSKKDCVPQDGRLTVEPGVATSVSLPEEWKKTEEAIKREQDEKLNAARAGKLEELKERIELAINDSFHGEVVKSYYEAHKLGYVLTADDRRRLKQSYNAERKQLQELLDWTYNEIKRNRTVDRSVDEIKGEMKKLFECYISIK